MTHFSLKRTLAQYLNQTISPKNHAVDGNFIDFSHELRNQPGSLLRIGKTLSICHQDIPLKKINHPEKIVYISAIARKLQSQMRASADDIAEHLMGVIKLDQVEVSAVSYIPVFSDRAQLPLTFEITQQPEGWLQFSLSAAGLSLWLQQLNQQGLGHADQPPTACPQAICPQTTWQIQYSYSRCCTLLRLAARDQIVRFCPIADRYQLAVDSFSPLNLTQTVPGTQQLIHTLINMTDQWDQDQHLSPLHLSKLAITVADAFEQFYRATPPWGLSLEQRPQWLGLARVTQVVLQRIALRALGTLTEEL